MSNPPPDLPPEEPIPVMSNLGTFDPSDWHVDDVNNYLANVGLAEHNRVIAAERAGKARVSIIRAFPEDPNTV